MQISTYHAIQFTMQSKALTLILWVILYGSAMLFIILEPCVANKFKKLNAIWKILTSIVVCFLTYLVIYGFIFCMGYASLRAIEERDSSIEKFISRAYKHEISTEQGTQQLNNLSENKLYVLTDLKDGDVVYYDKYYIRTTDLDFAIYVKHISESNALFKEVPLGKDLDETTQSMEN